MDASVEGDHAARRGHGAQSAHTFDETARMGHALLQGHAPGAGSSTQRPAPAPHGRPGRSGSLVPSSDRQLSSCRSARRHPARKVHLDRCSTPQPSADPGAPSRSRRARRAADACAAAWPPTAASTAEPMAVRPISSSTSGRAWQAARSAGSAARSASPGPGAVPTGAPARVHGAGRETVAWTAGVDAAWITGPGGRNLVDRSPCADRPRRAIMSSARRGRRNRSRDRRKAAGLIAR